MSSAPAPVTCEACQQPYAAGPQCPRCGTETCVQCRWCDQCNDITVATFTPQVALKGRLGDQGAEYVFLGEDAGTLIDMAATMAEYIAADGLDEFAAWMDRTHGPLAAGARANIARNAQIIAEKIRAVQHQ